MWMMHEWNFCWSNIMRNKRIIAVYCRSENGVCTWEKEKKNKPKLNSWNIRTDRERS